MKLKIHNFALLGTYVCVPDIGGNDFEPNFTVFETGTTKDSFLYRFYPVRVDESFFPVILLVTVLSVI